MLSDCRLHCPSEQIRSNSLVVVDSLPGRLVVAGLLGVLKIANVPNEGGRVPVGTWAAAVNLIILIVHDEPLLILSVEHPALVSIGGALVGGNRNKRWFLLVGDIVNGLSVIC